MAKQVQPDPRPPTVQATAGSKGRKGLRPEDQDVLRGRYRQLSGDPYTAYYQWLADKLGRQTLERIVTEGVADPTVLAKKLRQDPQLDNIDLALWNDRHGEVQSLARSLGLLTWPRTDTVIVLKSVARTIVADGFEAVARVL